MGKYPYTVEEQLGRIVSQLEQINERLEEIKQGIQININIDKE